MEVRTTVKSPSWYFQGLPRSFLNSTAISLHIFSVIFRSSLSFPIVFFLLSQRQRIAIPLGSGALEDCVTNNECALLNRSRGKHSKRPTAFLKVTTGRNSTFDNKYIGCYILHRFTSFYDMKHNAEQHKVMFRQEGR